METVSQEAMEHAQGILGTNRQDIHPENNGGLDVEAYLNHYGREIIKVKENGSSKLYCLRECVFDPAHAPNEAAVGITSEGKLFYQCFHESCKTRTWNEARKVISGSDSLWDFAQGNGTTSLSNCPHIYRTERQ